MAKRTYSNKLVKAISNFLKDEGLLFVFDEENGFLQFSMSLNCKISYINYAVAVMEDEYLVYAFIPPALRTGEGWIMPMAEFLHRANYRLRNGNFELDMRDGDIAYKCYVDCDGWIPSREIIKNSIYCPSAVFNHYGDGIVGIISGMMSIETALDVCENRVEDDSGGIMPAAPRAFSGDMERLVFGKKGHTETDEDMSHFRMDLFEKRGGET